MATTGKGKGAPRPQEDRVRRALSLGLRASTSPSRDRRRKIWWNTDAEVQGQAVRAIQAFANVYNSKLQSVEKNLLEDIVSALEGLLKAETEQVYNVAADITASLIIAGGSSVLGFGIQGLCVPLVHLLLCTKNSTVAFCATALRIIIIDVSKSRTGVSEEDLWKAFTDANVLNILASRLQKHEKFDGEGGLLYVSVADFFTATLHQWPKARFGLGSNPNFRKSVFLQCRNSNEVISCAALRLCAALALCGGVALLQIQEKEGLYSCLVVNTSPSKSYNIRREAFHFLYILSRSSTLSTSISESSSDSICMNITDAISEGSRILNTRWPPDVKNLVLEASQAAQGLLRLPGKHHHSFWRAGFVGVICTLLLDLYDAGVPNHVAETEVVNRKSVKYDRVLGPVLWDALSWLSANAPASGEESHMKTKQQEALVSKAIDFACAILLKVVDRRGFRTESKHLQDHFYSGLEGVSICKTVLFLLFSPSHYLASAAKHGLEHALQRHGYDWLPSFVSKLSLTFSSVAASENMVTVTSLMAACCLSISAHCRHQLLQQGVLDVLIEAVKAHSLTSTRHQTVIAGTRCLCMPLDMNTCCWDNHNIWEGSDPILFFSLWAFASLARGSDTAKAINATLKKRMSKCVKWDSMPDEEVDSHFLVLAGFVNTAAGLRWLASCCLACCGAYGFPSVKNQLSKIFNDTHSANIKMIFADGGHVYAHKVIIATKCPALMPFASSKGEAFAHKDYSLTLSGARKASCPVELNLSARIHEAPMKALLEFVYKGFVLVDEELVSEVKLLAKRCHMDTFFKLLQGKIPVWGSIPDTLDFTSALGSVGCSFS